MLRLQAGDGFGLDRLAAVGLDVKNLAAVAELSKSDGQTIAACAASAADAVGVVLGLHGQAEIEYVGDGGHINTARSHVGRHQNLNLALAQGHQAAVAHGLAQRAMQGHGREAILLQIIGQTVALNLGAGKHNRLVDGGVTQPVVQQFALVGGVVGPEQDLLDIGVLFLRAVDGDALGFAHDAGGQLLDTRCKRGAEHHGLLAVDGQLVDFGQVVRETQIEHAIGLIDHQKLHFIELDLHRALQVQQASGGRDHQIGVLQLGNLQLVGHAADHVGNTQTAAMLNQVDGVVRHLLGQLARRAQHQGAGGGGFEVTRIGGVLALGAFGRGFAVGQRVCHRLLVLRFFSRFGIGTLG